MRKLSDLIKENESTKCFKYNATVTVEGTVYAENEGSAGEMADKNMDEIPGMIDYEIINITPVENEGYINPDLAVTSEISENIDSDKANNRLEVIKSYIFNTLTSTLVSLNVQEKLMILDNLDKYIKQLTSDLF